MTQPRERMRIIRNIVDSAWNERGYTLMELVLVITITIVLSVVVVDIIYLQAVSFNKTFNRSLLLGEWRKTLGQMRQDLQEIDPNNIKVMNNDRLTFSDFDGQTIDYAYTPDVLTRNGTKLADWVKSDPFQYLDESQNVTAISDSLTFIRVTLDFDRNGNTVQLSELLYIRN